MAETPKPAFVSPAPSAEPLVQIETRHETTETKND
jgi:hypothetical protein